MGISRGLGYFESLDFDWAPVDEHMLGADHPCADTASTNSTRTFTWESETLPPSQSCTTRLVFSPNQILHIPTRSPSFYTLAARTVDTVFSTLLHLLVSLHHNIQLLLRSSRSHSTSPASGHKETPVPHSGICVPFL